MVIDLSEMVREVRDQVRKKLSGLETAAADEGRILGLALVRREPRKSRIHRFSGRLDSRAQLRTGEVAGSKLRFAVTHEAGLTEHGTDEVLEIADDVEDQRPAGIRDTRHRAPEYVVIRVRVDFARERSKVAQQQASGDIGNQRASI